MARPVALVTICVASLLACEHVPPATCTSDLANVASARVGCVVSLTDAQRHWGNAVRVEKAQQYEVPDMCRQCEGQPGEPSPSESLPRTFCRWCRSWAETVKERNAETSAWLASARTAQRAALAGPEELREATTGVTIDFHNSSAVEAMRSSREAIENCGVE